MRIGIVSDTHGHFDPQLRKILAGVEAILHAGDVGSADVLDRLGEIAPVRAVRGNVDGPELALPPSLRLDFGNLRIEMLHILPVPQSELEAWGSAALPGGKAPARSERFLKVFDESTGVVLFGHSHQPCLVKLGGRLFFNPGSAGKKRFSLPRSCGRLEATPERIEATILSLEGYNGHVLDKLRLNFEVGVSESYANHEEHQTRAQGGGYPNRAGHRGDRKAGEELKRQRQVTMGREPEGASRPARHGPSQVVCGAM